MEKSEYSCIVAVCPGDGSAREQAASCQRVLGGIANIAVSYATKRYRANLINWGIVPFVCEDALRLKVGDKIAITAFADKLMRGKTEFTATVNGKAEITLGLPMLTESEREILLDGCLINLYRRKAAKS